MFSPRRSEDAKKSESFDGRGILPPRGQDAKEGGWEGFGGKAKEVDVLRVFASSR
jgi:hypothetical protein